MNFKLYDCDVGIKVNGVSYNFVHVDEVTYEDPRFNRLGRGQNAGNKTGFVYEEGTNEPTRITCPIYDMPADIKAILDNAFENQTRIDFYAVSRKDGSSKMGKNSILSQKPQQLSIGNSLESLAVSLSFETFDSTEVRKS